MSVSIFERSAATSSQAPISSPNLGSSYGSLSQGTSSQLESSSFTLSPSGMSQMLHVRHETQLEVLLPISTPNSSNIDEYSTTLIHPMVTRSKSGVLKDILLPYLRFNLCN